MQPEGSGNIVIAGSSPACFDPPRGQEIRNGAVDIHTIPRHAFRKNPVGVKHTDALCGGNSLQSARRRFFYPPATCLNGSGFPPEHPAEGGTAVLRTVARADRKNHWETARGKAVTDAAAAETGK